MNCEKTKPSWDEVWMSMAEMIANRSYDKKHQVGIVIVTADNTQVLSLGYNGNYSGGPNEAESLEPGMSGFIHAEINALLKLDYNNPKKKIAYVTLSPCRHCAKCLINSKIDEVVFRSEYRDKSGIELLKLANIKVRQV
jgi:dCMP deaminase